MGFLSGPKTPPLPEKPPPPPSTEDTEVQRAAAEAARRRQRARGFRSTILAQELLAPGGPGLQQTLGA
jgi:hypothetical protein